jgi:hypothetical protein
MNKYAARLSLAYPLLASLALMAGCSSSDSPGSDPVVDGGGTTTPTADAGTDSAPSAPVGDASITPDAGSTPPATGPCTEDGSVCATFNVPASVTAAPARLLVGFYKALPPAGPPDKLGAQIDAPPVTAGKPYDLKMTGIDVKGDYWVYAVLYMPGGGQFQPKAGVDYVAQSKVAFTLDGKAMTLTPSFDLALLAK